MEEIILERILNDINAGIIIGLVASALFWLFKGRPRSRNRI